MQEREPYAPKPGIAPKCGIAPQWMLFALVLGVLCLSTVAFFRPIGQTGQTPTPDQSPATMETGQALTPTPTWEIMETLPPTAEEIGYTDGIIFCSTVLVLILLVGTLRETVRRKNR